MLKTVSPNGKFPLTSLLALVLAGTPAFGDPATDAAAVTASSGTNGAQTASLPPAPTARVAQYRGDRAAAISYTFDDGTHDQLQVVPLLNAHGFHGTFLIIASHVPDTEAQVAARHMRSWGSISWEKLREMQAEGHEMSNHSWSHPHLSSLNDADMRAEIEKADQLMAEKLGAPPLTFCYPWNDFNDRVRAVVLEHHVNDRTVCVGLSGPTFTQDFANKWVDGLIHDHGWGVTMIHQVSKQVVEKVDLSDELSLHTEATNLNVLNGQMDYVKSHNDAVWVDTFLNVSLYTKEQAAAKLAVTSTGDHKADVLLTCSLDPTLYHYPLTVVVALPGVTQASATQGISSIPLILGKDSVQVDVVPGIEPTSVTWTDGK